MFDYIMAIELFFGRLLISNRSLLSRRFLGEHQSWTISKGHRFPGFHPRRTRNRKRKDESGSRHIQRRRLRSVPAAGLQQQTWRHIRCEKAEVHRRKNKHCRWTAISGLFWNHALTENYIHSRTLHIILRQTDKEVNHKLIVYNNDSIPGHKFIMWFLI